MPQNKRRSYAGAAIAVSFDATRCIHAAECTRGLPAVFNPKARPWIQPDAADAEDVRTVVQRCPSGALQFELPDGTAEQPQARATARVQADGPLHLRGQITLKGRKGEFTAQETRLALCRCGQSKNKPYCDNSHQEGGFAAPGTLESPPASLSAEEAGEGPLTIMIAPNGPYIVQGPLEVIDVEGNTGFLGKRAALCRCGQSANKPFCDSTHRSIGFEAE